MLPAHLNKLPLLNSKGKAGDRPAVSVQEKKVRNKFKSLGFIELETRKDGTKFTSKALREHANALNSHTADYSDTQKSILGEARLHLPSIFSPAKPRQHVHGSFHAQTRGIAAALLNPRPSLGINIARLHPPCPAGLGALSMYDALQCSHAVHSLLDVW